jgi:hypothetical protein
MESQPNSGGPNRSLHPPGMLPLGVDPQKFDPRSQIGNITYIQIPEKYQDPDKSGLTIEVTNQQQTHDIDLR